jgi:hypothetical protein
VYLGKHPFKLTRGRVDNPPTLAEIGLWVPERHGRQDRILCSYRALFEAPLTRAISLLNCLSEEIDLFNVDYGDFVAVVWT